MEKLELLAQRIDSLIQELDRLREENHQLREEGKRLREDLELGQMASEELQEQLNRIRQNYPALPYVNPDGIYGQQTANAVRAFQQVFDLPATGVTDYPTWYEISRIYVGVSRIAEPD